MGVLAVAAVAAGAATVTVTATAADGRTASRTFAATATEARPFLRGWRLGLLEKTG